MRSAPAIAFEYRPSRMLAGMIVLLTVLAACALVASGLRREWLATPMVAALGYGAIALWHYLHPRLRGLAWQGDGGLSLRLTESGGGEIPVQGSLVDARVLGPLVVLALRWPRGRAALWLLPDNLDADTRRRLRARLALGGITASVNADSL